MPANPESPERPVRSLYERILSAWNMRNAAAMSDCFQTDGNLVGYDGSQVDTRPSIRAHLAPIFANHPTAAYVAKVLEIRQLGAGVALLRAVAGMVPPGGDDINPAVNTIHTLVALSGENSGEYLAALFQATPAAWHGRPTDAAELTEELRQVLRSGVICA